MGRFMLYRIDSRLVHGQVCTRWIPEMKIKRVVIVHDIYAADPFLCDLHRMVVPNNVVCDTITTEAAVEEWKKNEFGEENTIVIFQSIPDAMKAIELGMELKDIQIATLAGSKKSVTIYKQINVTPEDAVMVQKMNDMGIHVYCQMYAGQPEEDTLGLMKQKKFAKALGLQ